MSDDDMTFVGEEREDVRLEWDATGSGRVGGRSQ